MNAIMKRFAWLGLGTLWAMVGHRTGARRRHRAVHRHQPELAAQPNILFIFDNSGSMGTDVVTQDTYDGIDHVSECGLRREPGVLAHGRPATRRRAPPTAGSTCRR